MIYAIEMKDGSVEVMHVLSGTVEEAIAKWHESRKANVQSFREIKESEIPLDRTFRNAWTYDFTVDMDKAREIQMDNIRAARDLKLEELDIETLQGKDVQEEKQVLRDIPQTFDLSSAQTPEELKQLWPEELT